MSETSFARRCLILASARQGGCLLGDCGRGQAAQISAYVPRREIMILNKIDLLPHVDFDVDAAIAKAR
jgi:hypothetical protein